MPDRIYVCVCISASIARITRQPRPCAVVVAGSSATFICVTNSSRDQWCWSRFRIYEDIILCNSDGCRDGYSAHSSPQNGLHFHSLTIDSCEPAYSGIYYYHQCQERWLRLPPAHSAYLTVLGMF